MDTKYRISNYAYRSWQIEQLIIPSEDAKNQEHYWKAIKYPGTLAQAVSGLLELGMDGFTSSSVADIITAIESAEKNILDKANDIFIPSNSGE